MLKIIRGDVDFVMKAYHSYVKMCVCVWGGGGVGVGVGGWGGSQYFTGMLSCFVHFVIHCTFALAVLYSSMADPSLAV